MSIKAKESRQIKKARKKLKKQFASEEKKINAEALQRMDRAIHHYINRHAGERIDLKSKTFTLFDENKHPATPESKFVLEMLKDLQQEKPEQKPPSSLEERITYEGPVSTS